MSSGRSLWAPSQNGLSLLCLQLHSQTVVFSLMTNDIGSRPLPSCEPSQNGWVIERPHEHHQYSPGSSSSSAGLRSYTTGSDMACSCAKGAILAALSALKSLRFLCQFERTAGHDGWAATIAGIATLSEGKIGGGGAGTAMR